MKLKDAANLLIEIKSKIESDPESGYDNFIQAWEKLEEQDKRLLKYPIVKFCYEAIAVNSDITTAKLCFQSILLFFDEEYPTENKNLKFVLTTNINDVDIAKLFYTMKNRKYLSNTLENLAEVIANVFELNEKTIYSYLSDPSGKMASAKDLFK